MSPLIPEPDKAMDYARAEAMAAYAIASDPECNAGLAVPHLVQGWRWAYMAIEREPPPAEIPDLAAWVRGQCLKAAGEERADAAQAFLEAHAETEVPAVLEEDAVVAQLSTLRDRVDAERRRAKQLPPARTLAVLWTRRIGLWAGVAIAFLLVALRPWAWGGIGPWRAAYFPGKDLRGDPDVKRESDVDFEWGELPPTDSIPSDRFAAQYDTCLILDEDQDWTFQLIADHGAKLYIDGEVIIDIWEPPEKSGSKKSDDKKDDKKEKEKDKDDDEKKAVEAVLTVKGADYEFEAGVHHLRVEFIEEDGAAELHLLATSDEELPPGPIPGRLLEYPGEDIDEDQPCGGVSG